MRARRGRPTGDGEDRKKRIEHAASELFNSVGYDQTSVREIAARAGVDPKLVSHYFGSKANLFAQVLNLPPQADLALAALRDLPKEQWGGLLTEILLDDKGLFAVPHMVGVIKSAASESEVANAIRDFYIRRSIEPMLKVVGVENSAARSSVLSSLFAGLTFADRILEVPLGEPNDIAARKRIIAEAIQTILTSPVTNH